MNDLNERAIKQAQPGDTLRDKTIRGLELRAFTTKKVFYLYYRTKEGTPRHPKIGDYGAINLPQARSIAQQMMAKVALGEDPGADSRKGRTAPTVAEAWKEFEDEHLVKRKETTSNEYKRSFNKYVPKSLKATKVHLVTDDDIVSLHKKMSETKYMANRVIAQLQKFFNFCIDKKKYRPPHTNPCKAVDRYREPKRRRYMSLAETKRISQLLDEARKSHPQGVAFIHLLILTGARSDEIRRFRWSDLQGNKIILTEHKTDHVLEERIIHLAPAALDVINSLPRRKDQHTIVGIDSPKTLWERIRTEAGCPDLRMHDLRHSFASVALAEGYSLAQIGELLGHRSEQTTQRYAHLIEEAAVAATATIVDAISRRMKADPADAPPGELL